MDIKKVSLEDDMKSCKEIVELCSDVNIAVEFYSALCNVTWAKESALAEDELIIERLKGLNGYTWSCSWRYAGGVISDIRSKNLGVSEDYMDFYCQGNEGTVSETVRNSLAKLGWKPIIEEDDE